MAEGEIPYKGYGGYRPTSEEELAKYFEQIIAQYEAYYQQLAGAYEQALQQIGQYPAYPYCQPMSEEEIKKYQAEDKKAQLDYLKETRKQIKDYEKQIKDYEKYLDEEIDKIEKETKEE